MTRTGNKEIKLPYTFDIYNKGSKNTEWKFTKATIYRLFFDIENTVKKDFNSGIALPLPADKITYRNYPSKNSTDNWTKLPEIEDCMYAGAWYSDKWVEYNYEKYNNDWNKWFTLMQPYWHGKLSISIDDTDKSKNWSTLKITVNNANFNKAREEKIKELSDIANLKKWADESNAKEKAEIKKSEEEEEKRKKENEAFKKWWNSLSDDDRLSWSMGYGRGDGNYTGD